MELRCFNGESDGRLYVEADYRGMLFVVGVNAIDAFAEALKNHSGSEGDGTIVLKPIKGAPQR